MSTVRLGELKGKNLQINSKLIVDGDGNLRADGLRVSNGGEIAFGGVVSANNLPCITQRWTASSAIPANRFLSIHGGGDFMVQMTDAAGDDDDVNVIGTSMTAADGPGDTLKVCVAGLFAVEMETTGNASPGEYLEKSDLEDGKAKVANGGDGTVGMAVSTAGPGEIVYGMWKKNDV